MPDPNDPYAAPPWEFDAQPQPFDTAPTGVPGMDPFSDLPPVPDHWYSPQQLPSLGPVDQYAPPAIGPDIPPPDQAAPIGPLPDLVPLGPPQPGPPPWEAASPAGLPWVAQPESVRPDAAGNVAPPGPPGPLPDAITGVAPPRGGAPFAGDAVQELTPRQHFEQSVQRANGDPFAIQDEGERQRYLDAIAKRDPEAFAGLLANDQQRRADFVNARRKEMLADNATAQRQHYEDWKAANDATDAKMAAIQQDAQRIANTKIDRTGGLNWVSKLAGVVGAVVGGLVQGRTGAARNAGLDALNEAIRQGMQAQEADLERQKQGVSSRMSMLGREVQQHGDEFRAKEALRQSAYAQIDSMLASQAQQFDPRSKTALQIAATRAGISAAQQQALIAARQKTFENDLKERDTSRQEALAKNTIWHDRAQIGLGYAGLENDKANRNEARAQRLADKEAERLDKEQERVRQFAIGGVPKLQTDPTGKPLVGPDGKPVIVHEELRNADGKPWLAPDAESQRELRTKKTSAEEAISIIDEIRAIRNRVGGESSLLNSDEAQRLKVLKARSRLITKDGTQGMSSDKDGEILSDAAGTGNADSWRSQEAGLLEARARTESALNRALNGAKYTGPPIRFPENSLAKNTAEDDKIQGLLQRPTETFDDVARREFNRRTLGWSPADNTPENIQRVAREVRESIGPTWDSGASPDQQRRIAELGYVARGSDEAATDARKALSKISTSADTSALRKFAGAALQDALDYDIGSRERATGATYDPTSLQRQLPRGESSQATAIPSELKLEPGAP